MSCSRDLILSDLTYDYIVTLSDLPLRAGGADCVLPLGSGYELWYNAEETYRKISIQSDSYVVVPKCYGLLDDSALAASGILRLQNQPRLNLKGEGVLVGVIDTGIQYELDAFRNPDGSTRIAAIWDQSMNLEGIPAPENFGYGTEYDREIINQALASENPRQIVPVIDEIGHGTYLAGIACGSADEKTGFIGAVPLSELLVVKLKSAKPYLRDFYFIPEDEPAYQENDIMAAVAYLEEKAHNLGRPLVVFLGLGTNNGNHGGYDPLSDFLNEFAMKRSHAMVVAAGNEANKRHHFMEEVKSLNDIVRVEINVEENMPGFYVEFWALAPEFFSAEVLSPTGERSMRANPRGGTHQEYRFLYERTSLTMDYRSVGQGRRDQLIFFRFEDVVAGIWTIVVYPENLSNGRIHLWLPMAGMLPKDVFFLKPNPDITLTTPSAANIPITVGGYNSSNGTFYLDSGRGNTVLGVQKPDFVAPAVEVDGPGTRGQIVTNTGTSIGAAVTAGACAQILEWAVIQENGDLINTVEIKNILIRGAVRSPEISYPNNTMGDNVIIVSSELGTTNIKGSADFIKSLKDRENGLTEQKRNYFCSKKGKMSNLTLK